MCGIPGSGVLDAHCKLLAATTPADGIFLSEDLAKFFDTIDITQACAVLTHLGAPTSFVTLIQNFYFFLTGALVVPNGTLPPEDWCKFAPVRRS